MFRLFPVTHLSFPVLALTGFLSLSLLTACNEPLSEDNPVILKLKNEDQDIRGETELNKDRIITLEDDVQNLDTMTKALQKERSGPAPADPAVTNQLSALQKEVVELRKLRTEIDQLRTELEALKKKQAAAPPKAAQTTAPSTTEKAADATPSKSAEAGATAAKSEPPKPKVEPYVVKVGDTINSIARARGISASAIREASKIPAGREPAPGQRIWLPGR